MRLSSIHLLHDDLMNEHFTHIDISHLNLDELISKVYNLIASKGENVIAIYTGRHPSFVSSAMWIFFFGK